MRNKQNTHILHTSTYERTTYQNHQFTAVYNLEIYPELRAMVGPEATAQTLACTSGAREDEQEALRVLFRAFVTANTDVVRAQVRAERLFAWSLSGGVSAGPKTARICAC